MCSVKSLTKVLQKYFHQEVGQARRVLLLWLAVILPAVAITNSASAFDNSSQSVPFTPGTASLSPAEATYPLKVSANNRYLVDQDNVPFLMIGDAPQTLIANLSQAEAGAYMVNRRTYGINTLWINLLCNFSDGCNNNAMTFDGIAPFTVAGDLSTPNPAPHLWTTLLAFFQSVGRIPKISSHFYAGTSENHGAS
jgi:uncharacterized protein DUF4038